MQKLLIITISSAVAVSYKDCLFNLFGNSLIIKTKSIETDDFTIIENADVYLVATTSSKYFDYVMSKIDKNKAVLTRLTFKQKDIDALKKIKQGTAALLVNLSKRMALETISDLHRLGITNINFFPVYPAQKNIPQGIELAVTPGEKRYVPDYIGRIIDLGNRVLNANTVTEILLRFKREDILKSTEYKSYISSLAEQNYSIDVLANKTLSIENKYQMLIEALDIAVIGIDEQDRIFICNNAFYKIMNIESIDFTGYNFKSTFKKLHNEISLCKSKEKFTKIINLEKINFVLTVLPVFWQDEYVGKYILLQKFSEAEKIQHNLRMQLLESGHTAKYGFNDIIGNCPQIIRAKEIAKKAALSEVSILLTGESGTGKELFAHSIHNASKIHKMPFIAVNCAAFSENLLESELFGYEEGSFTGAKRGGKLGLFEYAHGGTLFLDEIEGMSFNLQVKLLRVLQEKEIRRVGGNRIIKVNVRIIAASNQNIKQLSNENKFRKDLYYRLNTIPIDIPPLRERGEDVLLIAEHIIKKIKAGFILSNDVKNFFTMYRWDGNIRELCNVLEYLKYVNEPVVELKHLPAGIGEHICALHSSSKFKYNETVKCILTFLQKARPYGLGRRTLYSKCKAAGLDISENTIRKILASLAENNFVKVNAGREGSIITQKGIRHLKKLG
ncbi:sigma 54-interacting transcriptional regulator [Treponema pedis]|uniref:sigma 54-interacting transcriptional regulator n=1 Tax=Treponema pedis TaxID=409322 RepID=UPI00041F31BE|nr:sigma 54-interacting transcriptional regulator [Treponema pedis]